MPVQKVFPLMENGPEFKIEVSILKDIATVMDWYDRLQSLLNVAIIIGKGWGSYQGKYGGSHFATL